MSVCNAVGKMADRGTTTTPNELFEGHRKRPAKKMEHTAEIALKHRLPPPWKQVDYYPANHPLILPIQCVVSLYLNVKLEILSVERERGKGWSAGM